MIDAVVERVPRWRRPLRWTVALVAVGLLTGEPFLLAATAVPLSAVAYGALAGLPTDVELRAERSIDAVDAHPGEAVPVRLTVENTGTAPLTDCRVVDGVPDELRVLEGTPRASLSLGPGDAATVEYAVAARRASGAFEDAAVRLRPLAGTVVASATVRTEGDSRLRCATAVSATSRSEAALPRAGPVATDRGGNGLEFHATREYQPGDPVSRIDWRRYAKTSELTAVTYREEQAARTVLVVDGRPAARATPAPGFPTGAELCAYAGERLFGALKHEGAVAGVVAVGLGDADLGGAVDGDGLLWIDPEGDGSASAQAATAFEGVQSVATRGQPSVAADGGDGNGDGVERDGDGPDGRECDGDERDGRERDGGNGDATPPPETVCSRLPSTARVVVVSPLLDEWPVALADRLVALGYPTVVVSPNVTGGARTGGEAASVTGGTGESVEERGPRPSATVAAELRATDGEPTIAADVAAARRRLRLQRVENGGATPVDWAPTDSIDAALRSSLAALLG